MQQKKKKKNEFTIIALCSPFQIRFGIPEDDGTSAIPAATDRSGNNDDTVDKSVFVCTCECVCVYFLVSLVVALTVFFLVLDKNWLQYTTTSGTTSTGAAFAFLPLILRVWLGQIITWDQVHHGRFA